MKFCPKCGAKVKPDAKFCPHCGYQLTKEHKNADNEKHVEEILLGGNKGDQKSSQIAKPKSNSQSRYAKWIVGLIVIIIAVVVGYRQAYLPNMVKSTVASDGFSSSKGYSVAANLSKHEIVLTADQDTLESYVRSLQSNHFDTRRIGVENQLSGLAHDINSKALGTWKIAIAAKTNQGTSIMWEYDGTKEAKRFQTTNACRELHQKYLEEKQEERQQAQEENRDEKIGAGLIGGGIGLLIGGL